MGYSSGNHKTEVEFRQQGAGGVSGKRVGVCTQIFPGVWKAGVAVEYARLHPEGPVWGTCKRGQPQGIFRALWDPWRLNDSTKKSAFSA